MHKIIGNTITNYKRAIGRLQIIQTKTDYKKVRSDDIVFLDKNLISGDGFLEIYSLIKKGVSAVITEMGGKTDHGTVVANELGVPRFVLSSKKDKLVLSRNYGKIVEINDNFMFIKNRYQKILTKKNTYPLIKTNHKVKINIGFPELLEKYPELIEMSDGVGFLRMEFLLLSVLKGLHPNYYIKRYGLKQLSENLSLQLEKVVKPFFEKGKDVWIRTNDFSPCDLRSLLGGKDELVGKNPAIGYRGICRSINEPLVMLLPEILSIKRLLEKGYDNMGLFPPMTRFIWEFKRWTKILKENHLKGIKIGIMVETPAVALNFEDFSKFTDFVIFGTNDLTQFTLALDRSDPRLEKHFSEENKSVFKLMNNVINICNKKNITSSIGGNAGSNWHLVEKLIDCGLSETSVCPDLEIINNMKKNIFRKEGTSNI